MHFPGLTTGSEGQAVRVVPCVLIVLCVCLGEGGCSHTKDRRTAAGDRAFTGSPTAAVPKPPEPADPLSGGSTPELGALLAGQVIDPFSGRGVEANIRWVSLDNPKEGEEAIAVAANPQGYFVI